MTITHGYCTRDQVRAQRGFQSVETGDDTLIDTAINAASRQIDAWCGRRFWQDASVATREFFAESALCCPVDDISTTTGLVVKIDQVGEGSYDTTLTISTDFIVKPVNAADRTPVWPYTELWLANNYYFPRLANGRPGVQVTAKFGWPAVPDDVTMACIIQAAQIYSSKDAIFGSFALNESVARSVPAMDRQAMALLSDYRIPAVG